MISEKISRLLAKYNIKTTHQLVKKHNMLMSVKDKFRCNVLGIYCIPCECSKAYVGQTGHSRMQEHECHIWLQQLEKYELEHSTETSHKIDFGKANILAKTTGNMDRLVKEATELWLNPSNFKRGKWIHAEPGMVCSH